MEMNDKQRKLTEDNISLVYHLLAREYPTFKYDEDLAQIGILGLCKAAMRWDESKGTFSTFAYHCIRNEIRLEFRRRNKRVDAVSLEATIKGVNVEGEELTLGDMLEGGDDTDITEFIVEKFLNSLTAEERVVFDLKANGYKRQEIVDVTGYGLRHVKYLLQRIKRKYLKIK